MKILIIGTTKGLGRYLAENLICDTFNRGDKLPDKYYDMVINCAYDHVCQRNKDADPIGDEREANIKLIENILCIPCGYLLHISTIDVYDSEKALGEYAKTKQEIERIIRSSCDNYCIIRCGKLVGPYMRHDNLTKMFTGEQMSLSSDSSFCFAAYKDLLNYVEFIIWTKPQRGNVIVGSSTITLKEVAKQLGIKPKWGKYTYKSPEIESPRKHNVSELTAIKQYDMSKYYDINGQLINDDVVM